MPDSLFRHNITVKRRTVGSQNALGEQTYTYVNVYTNIYVRIENYSAKQQYKQSGERKNDETIIYAKRGFTFQEQDQIYYLGSYFGSVIGINVALIEGTQMIDHYELIIEKQ